MALRTALTILARALAVFLAAPLAAVGPCLPLVPARVAVPRLYRPRDTRVSVRKSRLGCHHLPAHIATTLAIMVCVMREEALATLEESTPPKRAVTSPFHFCVANTGFARASSRAPHLRLRRLLRPSQRSGADPPLFPCYVSCSFVVRMEYGVIYTRTYTALIYIYIYELPVGVLSFFVAACGRLRRTRTACR